jgi:hypothetical protein
MRLAKGEWHTPYLKTQVYAGSMRIVQRKSLNITIAADQTGVAAVPEKASCGVDALRVGRLDGELITPWRRQE